MNFKSEKERLLHPQAKLIPTFLWSEVFNENLKKDQIVLLQTPIKDFLNNKKLIPKHQKHAMAVWACVFLANPDALLEDLLQTAIVLKLPLDKLLFISSASKCLPVVKNILNSASKEEIEQLVKSHDYGIFSMAAANNDLALVSYLEEKTPELIKEMIQADMYRAFRLASESGHIEMLRYLEEKAPEFIKAMIQADKYCSFRLAAENGYLEIVRYLVEKAPELLQEMIEAESFEALVSSSKNGHFAVVQYLFEIASPFKQKMIQARSYSAFSLAASSGYLALLKFFAQQIPALVKDMIIGYRYKLKNHQPINYDDLKRAAENGYLGVFRYIENNAHRLYEEVYKEGCDESHSYEAFKLAARNGHLEVLRYLEEMAPDHLQKMIQADNYYAYRFAAENGHIEVLHYLEEKAPELIQDMIQADKYSAFRLAGANGHLHILLHIKEKSPQFVQEMIKEDDYYVFRHGSVSLQVTQFLLSHYDCFANKSHISPYQANIFKTNKLVTLRAQRQQQKDTNPNGVFDLSDSNEIKLCFYIIRSIIRDGEMSLENQDNIRFLIDIPSVQALLHTAVTPDYPNELLRIAYKNGNDSAVKLLLTIPAVRELAEKNNFYGIEIQEQRDLGQQSHDVQELIKDLGLQSMFQQENAIVNQTQSDVHKKLSFKEKMNQCGRLGAAVLVQIERLQQVANSLNPYWINSSMKLNAILNSIEALSEEINEQDLNTHIQDSESAIYQALNIQRLSPITFLGRLGWDNAKSLQAVQEASLESRSVTTSI